MADLARELIQAHLSDDHLPLFAQRLTEWLIADLNSSDEAVPDFTESRAKALLRAADVVDDPTRHSFMKLLESNETAVRLALYDLLKESELAENEEVVALAAVSGQSTSATTNDPIPWSALAIAAYAWKDGYSLYQLDPASPPAAYTPAGQIISRAGHFMRQQAQRTATERDKWGRLVVYEGTAVTGHTPSLDQLTTPGTIPPLPPHYRPPIPVRYPEVARDTVQISDEDAPDLTMPIAEEPVPPRAPQITITEQDLPDEKRPTIMPPLHIDRSQIPPPPPRPRPAMRTRPQNEFGQAVQRRYRSRGPMTTTKLRITVQEYTDGPGLYGVQVRVKCQGIRSTVAGTTNHDGKFLCELPVPRNAGLTYDAEITWPRDIGGDVEKKSITLNADRTEFTLPFYRRVYK